MTKRSTNLNRWRKAGSPEAIADLMQMFGVSSEELRTWARHNACRNCTKRTVRITRMIWIDGRYVPMEFCDTKCTDEYQKKVKEREG